LSITDTGKLPRKICKDIGQVLSQQAFIIPTMKFQIIRPNPKTAMADKVSLAGPHNFDNHLLSL
jgi:hypothetical protein